MKNVIMEFDRNRKELTSMFHNFYTHYWVQDETSTDIGILTVNPLGTIPDMLGADDNQINKYYIALKDKLAELGVGDIPDYGVDYTFMSFAKIQANTKEGVMKEYCRIKEILNGIWNWFNSIKDKFHELFPKEPVEPPIEEDIYEDIEDFDLFSLNGVEPFFEKTIKNTNSGEIRVLLLYPNMIAVRLKKENATPNEIVIIMDLLGII